MKNLVKIKDTFFCSVRHCGKAMLLLVALTALSSTAWAGKYLEGNKECGILLKGSDYYIIPIKNNNEWDGTVYVPYFSSDVNLKISQGYEKDYRLDYWFKDGAIGPTEIHGTGSSDNGKIVALSSAPASGWVAVTVHLYAEFDGVSKVDYLSRSAVTAISPSLGSVKDAAGNVVTSGRTNQTYTLSASATGGTSSSYKYEFYVDGTSLGAASTTKTKSWTPTTAGTHKLKVKVTDGNISGYSVTSSETDFVINQSMEPTVLISKSEQVNLQEVTLFGYVKYTGCKNINNVGFIISQDIDEVEDGTAQVYNATTAPDAPIAAMSDFSLFSDEFENETYYYRAWMKASDNTVTLSNEVRSFEPKAECNVKGAASILPIFKSGETTESATFTEGSASIDLTVDKNSIADVYQWNVESKPDGSVVTFSAQDKRNTTVTVNKVGQYEFTLTASCTDGIQYTSTTVLTLNVCEPAEFTQLYLDKHVNNVLCAEEEATATCITKENYTYALYGPDGEQIGDPLEGTGGTQTWRHVEGEGVFTMRTSPSDMPYCAAIVSSATQSYNEPDMEITADTDLDEAVICYQPVTLALKKVTSDTYVDTNPTWEITTGSDKGYLLNEHNRLAYDSRAREKVVFKGGAATESQITVKASAYKTVAVEDEGGNYTKQCPTTVEVELTVKPAIDDCD